MVVLYTQDDEGLRQTGIVLPRIIIVTIMNGYINSYCRVHSIVSGGRRTSSNIGSGAVELNVRLLVVEKFLQDCRNKLYC